MTLRHESIQRLVDSVEELHGPVELYGSAPDEADGIGCRVDRIAATFSVLIAPSDRYDVQIESYPPGDYLYAGIVSCEEFLCLMDRLRGPIGEWPVGEQ